jgi:hypothetical protein
MRRGSLLFTHCAIGSGKALSDALQSPPVIFFIGAHATALKPHAQILERGCALLGYAPIGNVGMLLLATRLRSAAVLPGGHVIKLVTESRWLQLPLEVRACTSHLLSPCTHALGIF